jgi:MoaA/NifB/PqqE/SkfB family radical SAM enzyme
MNEPTGPSASSAVHGARFRVQDLPDFVWGFEPKGFDVEISNLDLPELAAPEATSIRGTADLYRADGTFYRRLTSRPIDEPVPIGGKRVMRVGLDIQAFAGDYQLRFGLVHNGKTAADVPLPTTNAPTPLRVMNTIFDAFVELVNACNFRCTFCPQTTLQRRQHPMDFDLAVKIVRDLADMGHHYPIRVHLLGEPLLYKRFFDFVEATHEAGQRILLATNGSRFDAHNVEGILRTGLDEMIISLNTPEEHLYDAQRGTTVPFAEYLAGIERMVAEIVRRGPPPKTRVNVLYDAARHDDPIQLKKAREVSNIWIDVVRRVSGQDLPSAEEALTLDPCGTTLLPLCEGLELQWNAYHSWGEGRAPKAHFCSYPWRQLAILVDGQATACCVDAEGEISLGDATTQSIETIWNGPQLNRVRESFLRMQALEPRCVRCEIRHDKEHYFPS